MRNVLLVTLFAALIPRAAPAQVPAVAVPDPASAAAAASAGAAAAPAKNLFSFFCLTPEQKAMCRTKFCTSPAGQLVNNLLKPAAGLTGGLIGPICPGPNAANPDNLKKPADSVQGAAAKIKAEEAQAAGKVADLEYLATKNCKRWPEAEAALINGLRAEKNECVRIAAAQGLARGCCCTPKVMKALTLTVNGSTADGFPAEDSPRVRMLAFVALERCVNSCPPPADKPPESPAKAPDADILPATYYTVQFTQLRPADVYAEARATLAAGITVPPSAMGKPRSLVEALSTAAAAPPAAVPTQAAPTQAPTQAPAARSRSLADVFQRARGG